jgi:hypothetical protein
MDRPEFYPNINERYNNTQQEEAQHELSAQRNLDQTHLHGFSLKLCDYGG